MSAGALRRVIMAAKRANGFSLDDLTVLSAQIDPYRLDTPAGHRDGSWCAEQFGQAGRQRIHLRGLHYAIVVRGNVIKPNGEIYLNDHANWKWLQETASKAARWLKYVPFDAITDERNAPPLIYRQGYLEPETWISVGLDVHIPGADDLQPTAVCESFRGVQPYGLVIIGEKSSLGEVLLPIAEDFHADLYLPTGEMSDTLIHRIASDAATDGRPLRVFYLSDFDPSGWQMPISVARKLQAHRDMHFPDLDFEMRPVALNLEQARELGLPSTPLKESERRADNWREAMGHEQTEIDALATLQPNVLRRIVVDALEPFFDDTLDERVREAQAERKTEAQAALESQIDQGALDDLKQQAEEKLEQLRDQIDELNRKLRLTTGDGIGLPEPQIPEAEVFPESQGLPLVSSAWDWVEQTRALIARKRYATGEAEP
jgi:hypothetical protein